MHSNGTPEPLGKPLLTKAPQRVLFFGKNMKRTRCTGALAEALSRHGLDVKWLNMATLRRWFRPFANRLARGIANRYRPDLVFVFCRDLPRVLLDELRQHVPIVLWVEEPLHDLCPEHVEYFRQAHLVCMSNPGKFAWLRSQGLANFAFVMSGFSPNFHYPDPGAFTEPAQSPKRDLVFIGGPGLKGNRAEFLAQISKHFRTEIFGPVALWADWIAKFPELRVREPVAATGYRAVCASSRIVLGMNQVNDDPLYFSNRTFLTLACRGFHLTRYVPGLETVFGDGEHLAWYRDEEECLEKIRHYLNAPEERERIAEAGMKLVLERHQYYHRVGQILGMLQNGVPPQEPTVVLQALPPRERSATAAAVAK